MDTVCVTGGTGFIGSWIVHDMLAAGYRVRATVRDPDNANRTAPLRDLPGADERLELVKAELLDPEVWDDAVAGCRFVIHSASPYALTVEDPQRDLVDPALKGTANVLEACVRAGVERAVVTSSMAAVTDEPDADHLLTEADWNERSSLERNPYYYSKTVAEREAWRIAEDQGLDVVVVNPFMVIGPSLVPSLNTSNGVFVALLTGVYPAIVRLTWGFVDVRDVSLAHLRAIERPEAKGRYLCANTTMSMRDLIAQIRSEGYDTGYRLPRLGLDSAVGDVLMKLGSYAQPKGVGTYLRTHIGRVPRFDHSKIHDELDVDFRPLDETIRDTLPDLVRWGHLVEPG